MVILFARGWYLLRNEGNCRICIVVSVAAKIDRLTMHKRVPEKRVLAVFGGSTLVSDRATTQPRLRVLDWRRLRSRLPRSVLSHAGCPGEPVGERSSPKICEDPRLDTLSLRGRSRVAKRRRFPDTEAWKPTTSASTSFVRKMYN